MDTNEGQGAPSVSVGQRLRRRRQERGLDLADIARETRISLRHLTAIENDDHEILPPYTYALGFVKNYARAVGLAPDEIGAQFRSETTIEREIYATTTAEPIDESRIPAKGIAIAGLAVVVLILLGWMVASSGLFSSDDEIAAAPAPVAATPDAAGETPVAVPQPTVLADAAEAGAAPDSDGAGASDSDVVSGDSGAAVAVPAVPESAVELTGGRIVLTATEEIWLGVYDADGGLVAMRTLNAGDSYEVPTDRQDLTLKTGKLGTLTFSVGGEALPQLGRTDEFVRALPLSEAALRTRAAEGASPPAEGATTAAPAE